MTGGRLVVAATSAGVALALALALAGCAGPADPGTGVAGSPVAASSRPAGGSSAGGGSQLPGPALLEACPASDRSVAPVEGGLPDLTLDCLDPGTGPASVRLAGLRGRPTVVNAWASWCGPCRDEMPLLGRAAVQAGGRVRFLGVDVSDRPAAARGFAVAAAVTYNSVTDPGAQTKAPFRYVGLPATLFVRADGVVAHRQVTPITDAAQLAALVRQYLGVTL